MWTPLNHESIKQRCRNLARCLLLLPSLAGLFSGSVAAQSQVPMYEGADRTQRLVEGAKREKGLMLYTSMAEKDSLRLTAAFEKKYGIKVTVWRAGKNKVLQRVITEAGAGRNEVDFVLNPAPEMEALHREKLLQPVRSPVQKDLIAAALPAHREWTGMRVYVFVQSYNTQKVSREELPKTWQDLLDPRWKGRLGIEAKQQEWFYALVQAMGEEKGLKFFRDLVATNGVSQRTGNSLLNNMVISGEVPLALNVYSYLPEQGKAAGAPIDHIALAPTMAYTDGIGIVKAAPHPHAATLFYDFMLTEGQKIVGEHSAITTHRRDEAALAKFKPVFIDAARVLDTYELWAKTYEDTLNGRPTAR
jgi:iron(III) transport system substrate-binding protein